MGTKNKNTYTNLNNDKYNLNNKDAYPLVGSRAILLGLFRFTSIKILQYFIVDVHINIISRSSST